MPRALAVAPPRTASLRGRVRSACELCSTALICVLLAPLLAARLPLLEKVLLAVVLLDTSFPIDASLLHREELGELSAIGGFNVSLTTLVLPVLYVSWILSLLSGDGRFSARLRASTPLVCYAAVVALSAFYAYDPSMVLRELSVLVPILLVHIYIASARRTRDVAFVAVVLISAFALHAFIAVIIGATGFSLDVGPINLGLMTTEDGSMRRVAGAFGHPNLLAAHLAMLLAPALSITLTDLPRGFKVVAVIGVVCAGCALLMTMSRGGLVAVGVSLVLFCVGASRHHGMWLAVPAMMAAGAVAFLVVFQTGFVTRAADDGGAASARLPLAWTALEMIGDHPLLGVGANNFTTMIGDYKYVKSFTGDWVSTVHNKYLMVWSETGLLGLAAFLWFLAASLRISWLVWRRQHPLLAPLALGLGAALAGEMLHMAVDIFNVRSVIQLLTINAGLLVAIRALDARTRAPDEVSSFC